MDGYLDLTHEQRLFQDAVRTFMDARVLPRRRPALSSALAEVVA